MSRTSRWGNEYRGKLVIPMSFLIILFDLRVGAPDVALHKKLLLCLSLSSLICLDFSPDPRHPGHVDKTNAGRPHPPPGCPSSMTIGKVDFMY